MTIDLERLQILPPWNQCKFVLSAAWKGYDSESCNEDANVLIAQCVSAAACLDSDGFAVIRHRVVSGHFQPTLVVKSVLVTVDTRRDYCIGRRRLQKCTAHLSAASSSVVLKDAVVSPCSKITLHPGMVHASYLYLVQLQQDSVRWFLLLTAPDFKHVADGIADSADKQLNAQLGLQFVPNKEQQDAFGVTGAELTPADIFN